MEDNTKLENQSINNQSKKKRKNRKKKKTLKEKLNLEPQINSTHGLLTEELNTNENHLNTQEDFVENIFKQNTEQLHLKDMKKLNANDSCAPNKEPISVERETRRLAKQLEKQKIQDKNRNLPEATTSSESLRSNVQRSLQKQSVSEDNQIAESQKNENVADKTREQILAERELKKQAKLAKKKGKPDSAPPTASVCDDNKAEGKTIPQQINTVASKLEDLSIASKATTKAERRAKQEAQRAAKTKMLEEKVAATSAVKTTDKSESPDKLKVVVKVKKTTAVPTTPSHRVKLFNHLYIENQNCDTKPNATDLHPAIVKLGTQYANRMIVGSNARCLSFMNAIKKVIEDYRTPQQKEFTRGLEETIQHVVSYLHQCRPLAVSVSNAVKFIKWQITQLPANQSETNLKEKLTESIDTYIRDQIEKACQAISISVQEKISNGDVILTFGCSSLIMHILEEAQSRKVDFRVVVVDARPDNEGQVMLERLVSKGIRCSFVLINAIGFIMPEVTKVLVGAHALLANGYVMARTGTSQVALVAKTYNVPVLVCCETHKFSERVQTDAFVHNELGNPSDIVSTSNKSNILSNWESLQHLTPLNLKYDITPPELVTAVVTEVAILPCTSVPVILRIKPSEIGY